MELPHRNPAAVTKAMGGNDEIFIVCSSNVYEMFGFSAEYKGKIKSGVKITQRSTAVSDVSGRSRVH